MLSRFLIALVLAVAAFGVDYRLQEANEIAFIRADAEIATLEMLQDIVYPEYCINVR